MADSPEQVYQQIYGEPFSFSPAYDARKAAGQVQTPGLVDWGGMGQRLYDDLQAPYWKRQDREQGKAVADPVELMGKSGYAAKPRFVAASQPQATNYYNPGNMYTGPGSAAAGPRVGTGPDSNRLTPNAMGYNNNTANPVTGKFPFNYPPNAAAAAIDNIAPLDDPAAGMKPGFNKMVPAGMPVNSRSRDSLAYAQAGRNALANMPPMTAGAQAGGVIDLTAVNPKNPQAMANSQGQAIQVGSKIYYPAGKAPKAAPAAGREPGPLGKLFGLQQGGLGGLLSGMFGGGQAQQAGGGGLGALLSGGSSFGSSPSQGMAMTVDPNTSTGSTLSGMGFSPGAAVPAATIRGLSERGYI